MSAAAALPIVWLALGGAAGTLARYAVATALAAWLGAAFPYGTLAVNLVGAFALGALASSSAGPTLTLTLGTGFLGGFTTYSTFSLDTVKLLQGGHYGLAATYVGITLVGGLLGTAAGLSLR